MKEELELSFEQPDDGRLIYSVSQISDEIKEVLEGSYPAVWVEGEISNFKLYNSGHMYFNVKDEKAQIRAVMFASANNGLTFAPQDGMKVLVFGRVSSYPVRGDYQIIINQMQEYGKGNLFKEFEKLKKKLEAEGLFDESNKKEIPALVNKIGVVTSQDGAALHDIIKVLDSLKANVEVLIYPVRVQGKEAEKEIPQGIKYLNKEHSDLDVLLVGRGGGSLEDLWAFNTEPVARAIFDSKIPVISCVGHETDFTIADFVSDMRAPTPSAAAEMAVRKKRELIDQLIDLEESLKDSISYVFEESSAKLQNLATSRAFTKPHLIYEDKISYVDELDERLGSLVKRFLINKEEKLKFVSQKLDLVSPLSVLKRGFAVCKDENEKILKDINGLKIGSKVNVQLSNGSFGASVEMKNDK